ncbi:MAG TPA: dihydrofolate reductase family protein [Candidatus Woesebacteria bacterium]|nr:dihydrofolate reductase family protein [Candidatus Woesebacteria bacterium]
MTRTPQVFIIVATSLDGFIAQDSQQPSTEWTSVEDNRFFHQKTIEAGAVLMGLKTYQTINFRYLPLKNRLNLVYTHANHDQVISQLGIQKQLVNERSLRTITGDPKQIVQQLGKDGISQLAVCGGSFVYTHFLAARVVNKMFVTIEPVVFGNGIKLFNQPCLQRMKLISSLRLNEKGSLLLEYDLLS